MHTYTIFPFIHFLLIYLFKWNKVFYVLVTLYVCTTYLLIEKNKVDVI